MNEQEKTTGTNAFQIHQGSYLNARLNKLLVDIDTFSLSPLKINKEFNTLNARLLSRSMTSVAVAIFGEVSKEEKAVLKLAIDKLDEFDYSKIFMNGGDINYDTDNGLDKRNWDKIKDCLLDFRLYLSELLEKYGLGISFEKDNKQGMLE